jgi:hypothetical protein
MTDDQALRQHVVALLRGHQAHMNFEDAVADFPAAFINVKPPNVEYTFWHLVEHLRFTQWDILDYMRNPNYQSAVWPQDYWPAKDAQADEAAWRQSIESFQSDARAIEAIVLDPQTDLTAPIPHGYGGHTILREALLVADHNAYHVGELGILRQVAGAWGQR